MKLLKVPFEAFLIFTICTLHVPEAAAVPSTNDSDSIKIGLLIQDNKSLSAWHGAEMAIRVANENRGNNGKPFKLVVRSLEGPWGTGSKQAVYLIFEENVCAILGSHNGRNAHLVEQVATKARIVFLSAWASDPTLSQAFVPWYFSCVPNDIQQADALIEEIYTRNKITKIAAVADNDYDSKLALTSFLKRTKIAGKTEPLQFYYDDSSHDFRNLLDQINNADVNVIVFLGQPIASIRIIQQIKKRQMNQEMYGGLSLLYDEEFSDNNLNYYDNVVLVSPGNLSGSKSLAFREEYKKIYGTYPGVVAAYAYDGMSLIIEAVRKAGTDREKIQKTLTKIHFEGVTGKIQFDNKGNRVGDANLLEIKNGLPAPVIK